MAELLVAAAVAVGHLPNLHMKNLPFLAVVVATVLLAGGCATGSKVWPSGDIAPTEPQAGTLRVRVESRPAGALVVYDGAVAGHAPLWVAVPVTRFGFFPDPTRIRVRFLAEDQSAASQSVTAEFGVLDKVPSAVVFTREGWSRVGR